MTVILQIVRIAASDPQDRDGASEAVCDNQGVFARSSLKPFGLTWFLDLRQCQAGVLDIDHPRDEGTLGGHVKLFGG